MGAAEVAVEARHPHQHEARERIGAEVPTSVPPTLASSTARCSALSLPPVSITTSYDPGTAWPMDAAFIKEVALRPSLGYCSHYGYRRDFAEAADLLAAPDRS
jgi:hypothetical protein